MRVLNYLIILIVIFVIVIFTVKVFAQTEKNSILSFKEVFSKLPQEKLLIQQQIDQNRAEKVEFVQDKLEKIYNPNYEKAL